MPVTTDLGPCYSIYLPLNQTTSCQYKLSKKGSMLKRRKRSCRVRIEIKHGTFRIFPSMFDFNSFCHRPIDTPNGVNGFGEVYNKTQKKIFFKCLKCFSISIKELRVKT